MKRIIISTVVLVLALFLGVYALLFTLSWPHRYQVQYDMFSLNNVNWAALPTRTLEVRCQGRVYWTIEGASDDGYVTSLWLPRDATEALVYSGNLLVATTELYGVPGEDNFVSMSGVPNPELVRDASSTTPLPQG